MSQVRAPSCQTTRTTQKVREVKPTQEKSKGKGKAKVINLKIEEVQNEKVAKLKAEIVVNLEMIAQLEG
jgi:hypothetical protein